MHCLLLHKGLSCALSSLPLPARRCSQSRHHWPRQPGPQVKSLRRVATRQRRRQARPPETPKPLTRRWESKRAPSYHLPVDTQIPPLRRCRATENRWKSGPIARLKPRSKTAFALCAQALSGCLPFGIGEEELLAVDLIGRDGGLTFG